MVTLDTKVQMPCARVEMSELSNGVARGKIEMLDFLKMIYLYVKDT